MEHPWFRSVEIEPSRGKNPRKPIDWAKLRDDVLLILEVGALVGLIIALIALVANLRSLRSEVLKAKITPEPTVAPLIESVASPESIPLPKSDTPEPTRRPIESPTPMPQPPTRIVIPAIGVDAPVVEGDGWEELKRGAGYRLGSANPGEVGNCIISGHNDIFGAVFRQLGDLELGDEVIVYGGALPYRYIVKEKLIVKPSEMRVVAHTTNPVLTLITCYPYLINTHRLIVIAELEG